MTTEWIDEGVHYVSSEGRRCRIATCQREDGLWTVAVKGCFSTFGVTRGNAIRNACKPADRERAKQDVDEYLAHKEGRISDEAYLAAIRKRHADTLAEFWNDARAHGEC